MRPEIQTRAVGAGLAAGLIGMSVLSAAYTEQDATESNRAADSAQIIDAYSVTKPDAGPSCIVPTPTDFKAAQDLLSLPVNPAFTPKKVGKGGSNDVAQPLNEVQQQIARENGLTTFDATDKLNDLFGSLYVPHQSQPFSYYLGQVQAYMQQLGVTLSVGTPGVKYEYGGHAPTKTELESQNSKINVVHIMEAFNSVPLEYVQLSGLKHIYMISGTEYAGVAAYATTTKPGDSIYLNIDSRTGAQLQTHDILHEDYHLLDDHECDLSPDAMNNDPTFTLLNGETDVYKSNSSDTHSSPTTPSYLGAYLHLLQQDAQASFGRYYAESLARFTTIPRERALAAKVLTYSDYHTDVMEDKAEIGAEIPNPYSYAVLDDPQFSILHAKFVYLFARLYHQNPAVARYFALTSTRPGIDPVFGGK